jgi:hypothetical protein
MVGVDGSAGSVAAVRLGAWEAKRRRLPLLLVHGYLDRLPYATYGWTSYQPLATAVRDEAHTMLTDIELRARADHPGLTVRSALVAGGGASTWSSCRARLVSSWSAPEVWAASPARRSARWGHR